VTVSTPFDVIDPVWVTEAAVESLALMVRFLVVPPAITTVPAELMKTLVALRPEA